MKNKELFLIALTVFLTIIGWISADIYRIVNTEKVKVISPSIVKPIDVHIDPQVFFDIQNKK